MDTKKLAHPKRFYLLFYMTLLDGHSRGILTCIKCMSIVCLLVGAVPNTSTRKVPKRSSHERQQQRSGVGGYFADINTSTSTSTNTNIDMYPDDCKEEQENHQRDKNIIKDDDFDVVNQLFFGTSSSTSNNNDNSVDSHSNRNGSGRGNGSGNNFPLWNVTDENLPPHPLSRDFSLFDEDFYSNQSEVTPSSPPLTTSSTASPATTNSIQDMLPQGILNGDDDNQNEIDIDTDTDVDADMIQEPKFYSKKFKKPAFKGWNLYPSNNKNIKSHTSTIRTIANSIIHDSTQTVSKVLRGDVAGHVPADIYGQTIQEEIAEFQLNFPDDDDDDDDNNDDDEYMSSSIGVQPHDHDSFLSKSGSIKKGGKRETGDENIKDDNAIFNDGILRRKLYGGAQYHRLLQCYHQIFLTKPIRQITEEEISLLIHGISDSKHDGTDLLRTVAILSSQRMDGLALGILQSLAKRIEFVLGRMWNVVEYTMMTRTMGLKFSYEIDYGNRHGYGYSNSNSNRHHQNNGNGKGNSNTSNQPENASLTLEALESLEKDLMFFVKQCFDKFVKQKVQFAYRLASSDIDALMRFVNWDLAFSHGSIGGSLVTSLSSSSSSPSLQSRILSASDEDEEDWDAFDDDDENNQELGDLVGGVLDRGKDASTLDQTNAIIDCETDELLMQVIKSVQETIPLNPTTTIASTYSLQHTNAAVNTLVQHVTTRWRLEIARIATTKFNAFCLVAFHDEFGAFLRKEMEEYLNDHLQEMH